MKALMNKIGHWLLLSVTTLFVTTPLYSAPRKYPNSGTIDLEEVYHVDRTKDKILKELGYTQAMLPDSFPAFTAYWTARGWPVAEMLDLYLFECAWNDAVWINDTYVGWCCYIRPNYVTQSRAWIIAPDGWYRVRYGCMTGLGRYSGKHAQVYSDRSGNNPGCTPGTAIEIDHAGWSIRQPDRVCLNSTAWGKDYGVIGGLAYTEGIIMENFRLVGNKAQAGNFTGLCTGATFNEPGENSLLWGCMFENFPGAGCTIFNGTPFVVDICSAFNNNGPGFDFLGSNGLCNVRGGTISGDDNVGDLVLIRPKDGQSVGGGTFTFTNIKSESRTVRQRPIRIEGRMGDLNLCIDGMTANFDGPPCDYLIGGNWTGTQFEINARGIDLRSNTQALAKSSTATLIGGKPFSGNSFVWNDEGLAFKSRSNMTLSTGTVTPPPTGSWTCTTWGACNSGTQTRTCTCSGTCSDPKPAESQACTVAPPTGGTMTATASLKPLDAPKAVDGNVNTFWQADRSMANGQTFTVDLVTARSVRGITFSVPYPQYKWWPPKFQIHTSTNGSTWTKRGGDFTGAASSVATWTGASARYVRITCVGSASDWWGINEVSVQ